MIFIDNKYTRWYYAIIQNAQHRSSNKQQAKDLLGYVERHHIIPECFYVERKRKGQKGWLPGNPDDPSNLVFLTAREHFVCHLLLTKMCENRAKFLMDQAFVLTAFVKHGLKYRVSSHWYEKAKILSAFNQSIRATGRVQSAEERLQRSITGKEVQNRPEVIAKRVASRAGYRHSEETKAKIAYANSHPSEETRRKLSLKNLGKKLSAETKAKISMMNKLRPPQSEETIRKRTDALRGRKHSPESIEKMKMNRKGKGARKWTEEQIRKRSDTYKKNKQNKKNQINIDHEYKRTD